MGHSRDGRVLWQWRKSREKKLPLCRWTQKHKLQSNNPGCMRVSSWKRSRSFTALFWPSNTCSTPVGLHRGAWKSVHCPFIQAAPWTSIDVCCYCELIWNSKEAPLTMKLLLLDPDPSCINIISFQMSISFKKQINEQWIDLLVMCSGAEGHWSIYPANEMITFHNSWICSSCMTVL